MKEEYKNGAFVLKVIKTEIVHFKIIISINTKKTISLYSSFVNLNTSSIIFKEVKHYQSRKYWR